MSIVGGSLSTLSRVIETIEKDQGIKREVIVSALEQAVLQTAQRKFGPHAVLEAQYNAESGEVDLFHYKKVVESEPEMLDESEEIEIQEARTLDPEAVVGDELGIKLEGAQFGRIDAQTAKQVIFQKIRDAQRENTYNEYIYHKGEVMTGIARRIEGRSLIVDLGRADAQLPRSEMIPGEQFKQGDRVQAYLSDVTMTSRGPQLYLTRTAPQYLIKLFEKEVSEIREGIVEVKGCVREPGVRAKIAVISKDRDVDPVGACVGMKGSRVQNVTRELKDERIDIVPWSDNAMIFVRSALSPAEISSVQIDEWNKTMEIIVDDAQLSIAIGKKGQNVRLAAMLTGWKLNILSKTSLQKRTAEAIFNLQHIEGVTETLAQAIYQAGFLNLKQVAEASLDTLKRIPGYPSEEAAMDLKAKAQAVMEKGGEFLNALLQSSSTVSEESTLSSSPVKGAKALAEERLKEMMKKASTAPSGGDKK